MKKVANGASRVFWYKGQALLPEHFYTQEQALREEFQLRLRLHHAAYYGLGSLQWDPHQFLHGSVSIHELSLVMPSGLFIDVPGNTPALSLTLSGNSPVNVYLHVKGDSRYKPPGDRTGTEGIERLLHRAELSTQDYVQGGQSFHLATLTCGLDKTWSLASSYIPPMLQVEKDSPFFEPYLRRIDSLLQTMQQTLMREAQDNHLATSGIASGRIALHGLYHLQALMVDLRAGLSPHPYELFQALRGFYIDLCVHQGYVPGKVTEAPYRHDDLASSFSAILERLEDPNANQHQRAIPYKEFVRREGLLVCELDPGMRSAKNVFFLVQKPQPSSRVDLSRVRLASESRIHTVYERSLTGIPYKLLESTPFQHGLSSAVEFYAISHNAEWDYAVREGKVVLFDSPQFQNARFYLYYRHD